MPQRLPHPSESTGTRNDPLFNNSEAADYIGITPSTLEVWRCTKRYQIAFIRVGRLIKYRQSALDAFLEQQTVNAEQG
jgi:excisionase family DNA binding protein